MATKATKVAGAAIGSAVLAAASGGAEAALISEGSLGANETFPGASVPAANTFDTIQGSLSDELDTDIFNYQGLAPGTHFSILVESLNTADIDAIASEWNGTQIDADVASSSLDALLEGNVPADGRLVVSVSAVSGSSFPLGFSENYNITLTGTRASVPAPASVALVTAGLVALGGLHVARRRRAG